MLSRILKDTLRGKVRFNSLSVKLMLIFFLCFILPVGLTCFVFYSVSVDAIRMEVEKSNAMYLNHLSEKLDNTFDTAMGVFGEYSAKEIFNKRERASKDIEDCFKEFRYTKASYDFIESIFVYDDASGEVISDNGMYPFDTFATNRFRFHNYPADELRKLFTESRGFSIVGLLDYTQHATSLRYFDKSSVMLLFTYRIYNRYMTIGILMDPSVITSIVDSSRAGHAGNLYILNTDHTTPLYTSSADIDYMALLPSYQSGFHSMKWRDTSAGRMFVNYTTSDYGLVLFEIIPWAEITASSRYISNVTYALIASLLLLSLILSLILSNQISEPLAAVSEQLTQGTRLTMPVRGVLGRSSEYRDIYTGIHQLQNKSKRLQSVVENNKESLRNSLLLNLLYSKYRDLDFLVFRLSELDIRFKYQYFSVVVLKIDLYKNAYQTFSDTELNNIETGLCNLCENWEYPCACLVKTVELSEGEYAIIINSEENDVALFEKAFDSIAHLIDMENKYARVSFAVTKFTDHLAGLSDLYSHARNALNYRVINEQSQVINSDCLPPLDEQVLFTIPSSIERSVANYMAACDEVSALQLIHAQIDLIAQNSIPYEYLKQIMLPFVNILTLTLSSRSIPISNVFDTDPYAELQRLTNIEEIHDFFRYAYEKASEYIGANKKNNPATLQKILIYIKENFHRDLSLEEISKFSNFSPQYFSRFFKEQMGVTFTDYVNQLRIQKAKILLSDPDSYVNSVAAAVGFDNVNSFIRMFKRYEGISPGKYKSMSEDPSAYENEEN